MIRRSRSRVRTALALAGAALLAVSACTTAQEEQARLNGEAAACPVEPDPSVRATVRIGWQAIPTGDLIVQERHLLESCLPSATIQWVQFDGGDDVVQAFGSGSIDLGISGSSAAVTAMSPPLELPVRLVWIAEDPDAAAESMAQMLGTDPQTVREQMTGYSYPDAAAQAGPDYFGGGVAGSPHSTAGFLGEIGLTGGAPSEEHYEQIVYPDAIQEVAAS